MEIRGVKASIELDSRREQTIEFSVHTHKGTFKALAPEGKSTGRHEAAPWKKSIMHDVVFLNKLNKKLIKKKNEINKIEDIERLSRKIRRKIGANSRFVFEAALLKALAAGQGKELWQILNPKARRMPMPIGNAIGGGKHSLKYGEEMGDEKIPEFQEFLFIARRKTFKEAVEINEKAYSMAERLLEKAGNGAGFKKERNDEGAWKCYLGNEEVLDIMKHVAEKLGVYIGIDVAASSFYNKREYKYRNASLNQKAQIYYINSLIEKYDLFYVEDPVQEDDFKGFSKINSDSCLIVGDDLTTTHIKLLKKAIKKKSISAIIIKPNQNGSLFDVKKVVELAKKNKIKLIVSHRSGETTDNTIADLAFAWQADYIKTGIHGKERKAKLNRLIEIEKGM